MGRTRRVPNDRGSGPRARAGRGAHRPLRRSSAFVARAIASVIAPDAEEVPGSAGGVHRRPEPIRALLEDHGSGPEQLGDVAPRSWSRMDFGTRTPSRTRTRSTRTAIGCSGDPAHDGDNGVRKRCAPGCGRRSRDGSTPDGRSRPALHRPHPSSVGPATATRTPRRRGVLGAFCDASDPSAAAWNFPGVHGPNSIPMLPRRWRTRRIDLQISEGASPSTRDARIATAYSPEFPRSADRGDGGLGGGNEDGGEEDEHGYDDEDEPQWNSQVERDLGLTSRSTLGDELGDDFANRRAAFPRAGLAPSRVRHPRHRRRVRGMHHGSHAPTLPQLVDFLVRAHLPRGAPLLGVRPQPPVAVGFQRRDRAPPAARGRRRRLDRGPGRRVEKLVGALLRAASAIAKRGQGSSSRSPAEADRRRRGDEARDGERVFGLAQDDNGATPRGSSSLRSPRTSLTSPDERRLRRAETHEAAARAAEQRLSTTSSRHAPATRASTASSRSTSVGTIVATCAPSRAPAGTSLVAARDDRATSTRPSHHASVLRASQRAELRLGDSADGGARQEWRDAFARERDGFSKRWRVHRRRCVRRSATACRDDAKRSAPRGGVPSTN